MQLSRNICWPCGARRAIVNIAGTMANKGHLLKHGLKKEAAEAGLSSDDAADCECAENAGSQEQGDVDQ
jgi:hypothetical protein